MGVGPAFAIPAVLNKAGLNIKDIDIFEINEAFASQALYCVRELGIDIKRVNPQGGAIAIGHPLGVTGARQIATGLARAKKTGEKLLVTSMCIGSGMVRIFSFVTRARDYAFLSRLDLTRNFHLP
jgi:acetyl-CoA acyltransferase 1